jgi:hypothetical protein
MDPIKARYAKKTDARKLAEVIEDADVFLGLSAGGVLKPEMVSKMAKQPLILALANPTPEILPHEVKAVRDDAIIATSPCSSHQLCAIYAPSIAETIRTQLSKNEHKIRLVLDQSRTKQIVFEKDEPFLNLNHPHEYEKAQELL